MMNSINIVKNCRFFACNIITCKCIFSNKLYLILYKENTLTIFKENFCKRMSPHPLSPYGGSSLYQLCTLTLGIRVALNHIQNWLTSRTLINSWFFFKHFVIFLTTLFNTFQWIFYSQGNYLIWKYQCK